jgi:phage/plasmid-like protein (TIGR03299 family)
VAHELEIVNGSASFVSAREHAWHRLGTVLPNGFTAAQAMQHARLGGWNVRKEPLQTVVVTEDGVETVAVAGRFATVRTSPHTGRPEALGVVGEQYVPIQNEEHTDLLDALVDESGAHFDTAGSLREGRAVFVTMKLPYSMRVGGVDDVDVYLAACNSHDGASAFRLLVTPVRIVCANTQAAAIRAARSQFSIHHTSGAKGQVQAARDALGLTFRYVEAFQAEAEAMIATAMTDAQFRELVRAVWPIADRASERVKTNAATRERALVELFTDSPTNTAIRGTRWAGYQAVTEYLDHHAPIGKKTDTHTAAAARAERVVASGQVSELRTRAFDLLTV